MNLCKERNCTRPATHRVYWPGVAPFVACARHQWIAETLAAHQEVKGVVFEVLGVARVEAGSDGR